MNTEPARTTAATRSVLALALVPVVGCYIWLRPAAAGETAALNTEKYGLITLDIPGAISTHPASINRLGQVTGSFIVYGGATSGFVFSGGTFTTFAVPEAFDTGPVSINDGGQVVGTFRDNPDWPYRNSGFIYRAGTFVTLDAPAGTDTYVGDGNNRAQIVGNYVDESLISHGFAYSGGVFTTIDLSELLSEVCCINDRGQIAGGYAPFYAAGGGVFVYSGGTFRTFGVPGFIWGFGSRVSDINDRAEVVGLSCLPRPYPTAETCRGFLLSDGVVAFLDTATGLPIVFAESINDRGQVTGTFRRCSAGIDCNTGSFVYYGDGKFEILNVPGADNTYAASINNSGQVTGWYSDASGGHGFIATPVVAVLDDFNRGNGTLGANWKGRAGLNAYRIVDQQVSVGTGGPVYWQPNPFGLDQEAFVTLTRIDPEGGDQGILLKVQGDTGNYRKGAIAVKYDAVRQVIRVATWRPRKGFWRNYRDLPAAFADGDKLGARVLADGKVRIFRNGQRVGRITLGPADRQFLNSKTGRIGLWFENAPNATLDDFGGGTRMQ